MTELRRKSAGRFSGALWGILIAGCGVLMIASFTGFDVDFELASILALGGIGLWLLLTALFSSGAKSRDARVRAESTASQEDGDADDLSEHLDNLDGTTQRPNDDTQRLGDDAEGFGPTPR